MNYNQELQIIKLKAKEALSSQRTSEQRTRIRELEGEVRVREQSYTENMIKIKKMERQLVTAEVQNFFSLKHTKKEWSQVRELASMKSQILLPASHSRVNFFVKRQIDAKNSRNFVFFLLFELSMYFYLVYFRKNMDAIFQNIIFFASSAQEKFSVDLLKTQYFCLIYFYFT